MSITVTKKQEISMLLHISPSPFPSFFPSNGHPPPLHAQRRLGGWFHRSSSTTAKIFAGGWRRQKRQRKEWERSNWKYAKGWIWWQGMLYLAGKVSPWMRIEERSNIPKKMDAVLVFAQVEVPGPHKNDAITSSRDFGSSLWREFFALFLPSPISLLDGDPFKLHSAP